jgi:hypothetical protein
MPSTRPSVEELIGLASLPDRHGSRIPTGRWSYPFAGMLRCVFELGCPDLSGRVGESQGGRHERGPAVIKYVYEVDYPLGQKRAYLEWVRSIADTLQAPDELKRLASYDNVFSATPNRVIEFTFESMEEAGRYFDRKEIGRILQGELPARGTNIRIKTLKLLADYSKDVVADQAP